MTSCLRRLAEEINKRTNFNWDVPYKYEFVKLMKILEPNEKILLKKYFCSLEWNIGSANVLVSLQSCGIISATEYILTQEDDEHIQLVLNDFLETNFELLANVVINCFYDFVNTSKITALLEECFKRLFHDLKENPASVSVNYFSKLKILQLQDEVVQMLKRIHVNVLLLNEKCTLKNAFGSLQGWQANTTEDNFFQKLICEIVEDNLQMLQFLLKKSLEPEFQGWKYFTSLLQIIAINCTTQGATELKKHLKGLLKLSLREKDDKFFYIMLFTARIVYTVKNANLETYQQWFKATIGEMNYLVSPQEFKYVMTVLSESLDVENVTTYLEIQTNTAIPAPPRCNQLVLNYKQQCRQKLSAFKNVNISQSSDKEESIVID